MIKHSYRTSARRLRTYRGGKPPYRSLHYRPLHGRSPAASFACNDSARQTLIYFHTLRLVCYKYHILEYYSKTGLTNEKKCIKISVKI